MKKFKYVLGVTFFLIIGLLIISYIINAQVKTSTKSQIKKINEIGKVDAIIVLGASVRADGSLSPMLKDRLDVGIEAYNSGMSTKIIMSGDYQEGEYDEVTAMQKYALENNVVNEDILLDKEGFSTYESIYRAKEKFGFKKIAVVTQEYHLYRALYIANKIGIQAYGIDATKEIYNGQKYRDVREYLARIKDFFQVFINYEIKK